MTDCSKCLRTDVKCCFTCKKDADKCKVWHHCGSDCPAHESRIKTNADRIRSMSDEELYNLIEKVKMCGDLLRTEESSSECKGCKDGFCCNVLHWLKSEAE